MNRNSALIWLPKIEAAGLPTPKTIIVPYDHRFFVGGMENHIDLRVSMKTLADLVKDGCNRVGEYPVFIRTDLGSAKHSGSSAYQINKFQEITGVIYRLIEYQELKFWLEEEPPEALMVREFLRLDASFTAFHGLPISREWRFFADGEKVRCFHPYWPVDVIKNNVGHEEWDTAENVLKDHHTIPDCFESLAEMAIMAAGCVGGDWSVDFAMDKSGKWWLIDMALAKDSWHWPGCCA